MKTAKCTKCPKSFTHPTEQKAQQALAMHVGRMHTGRIPSPHRHSGVLQQRSNGSLVTVGAKAHSRSNLQREEVSAITGFIRQNQSQFANKTACMVAAIEHAGVAGRIKPNSTAVNRYFAKAAKLPENYSGLEVHPIAPTVKRKYTKKAKASPVHQITVKFCPCCGTNMEAVATGLAMAAHMK